MRAVLSLVALSCWLVDPASSQSRGWRPADRVVIGDFTRITSIAASLERVYFTSPTALLIWHPQARRWDGPFDAPDPAVLGRAFAALADPLDNSLWVAAPDGWLHYQPDIQLWEQGIAPDGIRGIAFDLDDPVAGLFIRTSREWQLLPRGGTVPVPGRAPARPLGPATVEDAARANPALRASAAQVLSGAGFRQARFTAAARAADHSGWYLGTSGVGALFLSDVAVVPERLAFGLPTERVTAVLSWPGGVWAATERTSNADAAITFVGGELDQFRTLPEPSATGPRFATVRELAGQGTAVWAATDAGVARIDTKDGLTRVADDSRGLPESRVYAIAARRGRVTAGTARGLARVDDTLQVTRLAPSFSGAVYAVLPAGDSVWVGTPGGLLLVPSDEGGAVRPRAVSGSPSLQASVLRLATMGDTVVALTRDHLVWLDPRASVARAGPSLASLLGTLTSFAVDGPGLWVAGERSVGFARLDGPPLRILTAGDLPGRVRDVAVDEDFLWVATDRGLVRFRRDAIRP